MNTENPFAEFMTPEAIEFWTTMEPEDDFDYSDEWREREQV